MKTLAITLLIFTGSSWSQEATNKTVVFHNEPTDAEIKNIKNLNSKRKQVTVELIKFIEKEYALKADDLIPNLEKRLASLQAKRERSTNENYKEKATKAITAVETELQIQRMWKLYYKAFVACVDAREKSEIKRYKSASNVITQIKSKYKELKAEKFPSPDIAFFKINAKKVKKFLNE